MGTCVVEPGTLSGRILVPPSKSMGHRALFCAALAAGTSHIDNFVLSKDMHATLDALKVLGVPTEIQDSTRFPGRKLVIVQGTGSLNPTGDIVDCIESGSTARFVIPFSRLSSAKVTVTGRNGLLERPFGMFQSLFHGKGVVMTDQQGCLPVTLTGALQPGTFRLKGNVSSQFITGLLFVLPLLAGDSEILVEGPLESAAYVAMTLEMLQTFGVRASMSMQAPGEKGEPAAAVDAEGFGARLSVPGRQRYQPTDHVVEGDWSQSAFWLVAGALGHRIVLDGLRTDSLQGDRAIVTLLRRMGMNIREEGTALHVGEVNGLQGIEMDVAQCPDLVPALAVAAAHANGVSRIINAARLRFKECDRIVAVREMLENLGANVSETPDGLVITGGKAGFSAGSVAGYNDHRIVMAAAIAATRADGGVTITDREAVQKSYPEFWTDFRAVCGKGRNVE